MSRAPEHAIPPNESHAYRLRQLMTHFHAQERSMRAVLQELQARLELSHREASYQQVDVDRTPSSAHELFEQCLDMQAECDRLATELVHVRMAISGTGEELAQHEGKLLHLGSRAVSQRLGA